MPVRWIRLADEKMVTPLLYHATSQLCALPRDQLLDLLPSLLLILPLVLRCALTSPPHP